MGETSKKPRGWNFKKGAKDTLTTESAQERGSLGGKVKTPKGFASAEVQASAQMSRELNKIVIKKENDGQSEENS